MDDNKTEKRNEKVSGKISYVCFPVAPLSDLHQVFGSGQQLPPAGEVVDGLVEGEMPTGTEEEDVAGTETTVEGDEKKEGVSEMFEP